MNYETKGEKPNNPWIARDLTKPELAKLREMVESAGWAIFTEIKEYSKLGAISNGMNTENPQCLRDASVGVWRSALADLQFREDVMSTINELADE